MWFIYKEQEPVLRLAAASVPALKRDHAAVNLVGWILLFTVILAPIGILLIVVDGHALRVPASWPRSRPAAGDALPLPHAAAHPARSDDAALLTPGATVPSHEPPGGATRLLRAVRACGTHPLQIVEQPVV
ncbi:hypothetical protein QJS66_12215 [Kocuria rhizophila]|nr:hypothetical protein QJS66_12215 [Kocuria rhizophila]